MENHQPQQSVVQLQQPVPKSTKRYFSIGEISALCQLEAHVLRYWEQEFPQLNPSKRRGRRYYQRADILMVAQIKNLLYQQGFTIKGARVQLSKRVSKAERRQVIGNEMPIKEAIGHLEDLLTQLQEN